MERALAVHPDIYFPGGADRGWLSDELGAETAALSGIANLLMREYPAETIEAYDGIVKVILRGRVLDCAELAGNRVCETES